MDKIGYTFNEIIIIEQKLKYGENKRKENKGEINIIDEC